MELDPCHKLNNLKRSGESWDALDLPPEQFTEVYIEVALKLFQEDEAGVSSDYSV